MGVTGFGNTVSRLALPFLAFWALPGTAAAESIALPLNLQVAHALNVLLAAGSSCVTFSYDLNGNRTSQSVSTIAPGSTTWGSKSFGCFLWKP